MSNPASRAEPAPIGAARRRQGRRLTAVAGSAAAAVVAVWLARDVFRPHTRAAPVERIPVLVGASTFHVETAGDPAAWRRGLMFRRELPADGGMLFIYPDSQSRTFWMKDTRVPLSLAFLDRDKTILEIIELEPLSETPAISRWPAQYALELPAGAFARAGARPGDRLAWPMKF